MSEPQVTQSVLLLIDKESGDNDVHDNDDGGNPRWIQSQRPQQQQSLPLEWTRMKLKRPRTETAVTGNNNNDNTSSSSSTKFKWNNIMADCNDVNCRGCSMPQPIPQQEEFLLSNNNDTPTTLMKPYDLKTRRIITIDGNFHHFLSGKIIFCLPDQDCEWFQGYFFPFEQEEQEEEEDHHQNQQDAVLQLPSDDCPMYGVLCTVKQDIDECLQCHAGGYREISNIQMNMLNCRLQRKIHRQPPDAEKQVFLLESQQHNEPPKTSYPKHINVSNVTWVGGDMMTLYKTVLRNTTTGCNKPNVPTSSTSSSPNITTINTTTATPIADDWNDIPPTMSVLHMQTNTLYTGSDRVSPFVQRFFSASLRSMMDAYNSHPALLDRPDSINDDDNSNPISLPPPLPISLCNDNYPQVIELLMPDVAIVVGTMNLIVL
jgi:hypothetical protein